LEPIGEIKETQEKAFTLGLENAEDLAHNVNEMAAEVVDLGSNNIQAWNEFGSIATGIFRNIGSEMMESYQDSFSNCMEISQEALKCRTTSDMADLQSKVLQRAIEGYFDKSTR
jgi:ribosomal protein S17E